MMTLIKAKQNRIRRIRKRARIRIEMKRIRNRHDKALEGVVHLLRKCRVWRGTENISKLT